MGSRFELSVPMDLRGPGMSQEQLLPTGYAASGKLCSNLADQTLVGADES